MAPPQPKPVQPQVGCDRFDSCPHAEDIRAIRADIHEIKQDLIGDGDSPGFFERVRDLEKTRHLMLWVIAAAATPIIGAVALGLYMLLSGKTP